jgi:uncharacterized protein YaaR (DUF327 family)
MGMIEKTLSDLSREEKLKIKGKKRAHAGRATSGSFTQALDTSLSFDFQGSIDELMEDLRDQEKKFLDNQTNYELQRYKALVQKILKSILEEGFKTTTLKRPRRNKADFTVIEKINARLLELTGAITRGNKAFNLLKSIEEIRGLLLDLAY